MSGHCPWCLMTDQTSSPSESQRKCRHPWHVGDDDPMVMRPLDAWGPPGGAAYPLPPMPKTFSTDECIKMLANVATMDMLAAAGMRPVQIPVPKSYSVDDCIKMLSNVGVDTTCGACMALAFTGSVIEPHTCAQGLKQLGLENLLEREYHPPKLFIYEEVEIGGGYHSLHVSHDLHERGWSEPFCKSSHVQYRSRVVLVPYPPRTIE